MQAGLTGQRSAVRVAKRTGTGKDFYRQRRICIIRPHSAPFKGKLSDIAAVRDVSPLPILRKDFIIDEYQVYESRAAGADAILLIAAILTDAELNQFLSTATRFGMDCLVEVHSLPELERVKTTSARLMLLASCMGGVLLMAADTLARWLIAPQELPVGVLTAVLGGGYLLWLMQRNTRVSRGGGL